MEKFVVVYWTEPQNTDTIDTVIVLAKNRDEAELHVREALEAKYLNKFDIDIIIANHSY